MENFFSKRSTLSKETFRLFIFLLKVVLLKCFNNIRLNHHFVLKELVIHHTILKITTHLVRLLSLIVDELN